MKISAVATALPPYRVSADEVAEAATGWLHDDTEKYKLFERFLRSSEAAARYYILPPRNILELGGMAMRAKLFEREAPRLALHATQKVMQAAAISGSEVDALMFTSCSCPLIPAPDTYLVDALELPRTLTRLPAYQFGCAGGVIGLGLSLRLAAEVRNMLLVSTELCSLVFHADSREASDLIGAAIFADGAAAVLLSRDKAGPLELIASQSYLLPETRHLMGYEIEDSGARLLLDKSLPGHLIDVVPSIVDDFLHQQGHVRSDIDWWLLHPGGTKILASLHEVLGLRVDQARWSDEVLSNIGNLSSASILFVVNSFFQSEAAAPGDLALILGIGPGLTLELVLARCS